MNTIYNPQSNDIASVQLPQKLLPLVESMTKNIHEVRAQTRIKQSWTYGLQRNDEHKTYPCLVPNEQLPEEEILYDRNTSIQTLKFIRSQGFKINN